MELVYTYCYHNIVEVDLMDISYDLREIKSVKSIINVSITAGIVWFTPSSYFSQYEWFKQLLTCKVLAGIVYPH